MIVFAAYFFKGQDVKIFLKQIRCCSNSSDGKVPAIDGKILLSTHTVVHNDHAADVLGAVLITCQNQEITTVDKTFYRINVWQFASFVDHENVYYYQG